MGTVNSAIMDAQEMREQAAQEIREQRTREILDKPKLEEFKFIVQPVLLIKKDGRITGEQAIEPIAVYGLQGLRDFCKEFPDDLARLNVTKEIADA